MRVWSSLAAAIAVWLALVTHGAPAFAQPATAADDFDSQAPHAVACALAIELVSLNPVRLQEYRSWLGGLLYGRTGAGRPVDVDAAMDGVIAACRSNPEQTLAAVAAGIAGRK
ncbi:MAG: hypothetical protein KGM42_08330 [Hyphomicrobiales bacterium]|nr:hypothetical protein [Hyphomicrobiales bacterium]